MNFVAVFEVPEVSYFTKRVSGSVPSVAATPTQFATTPEVAPVNFTPLYFVISDRDLPDNFTRQISIRYYKI